MNTSRDINQEKLNSLYFKSRQTRYFLSRRARAFGAYLVLLFFVVFAVGPVLYLISPALRDSISLFDYPPKLIPDQPTLQNFRFGCEN